MPCPIVCIHQQQNGQRKCSCYLLLWIMIKTKTYMSHNKVDLVGHYLVSTVMWWLHFTTKKSRIRARIGPFVCMWFKSTDTVTLKKSIPWVQVKTMSPSVYQESKCILCVQVFTMTPNLYWVQVQVYIMSPSLNHRSKSTPWLLVSATSPNVYHEAKGT